MVALAHRSGIPRTAQQLASACDVPVDYLSKVLNSLCKANLVKAQRGRGGGFLSVRPSAEMTVLEVVNAVDPIQRIKQCPLGLAAHGTALCPLHRKLDDAALALEQAFTILTLGSLVPEQALPTPFCEGGKNCNAAVGLR